MAPPDHRPLVVHVITRLELGGAQQNTLDTCRRLDRARFRVALLAGPGGVLDAEARAVPDLTFETVPNLVREVSPRRDRAAFRWLRGRFAELAAGGGPLIVHTHSSKAGIVGRLAARAAGAARIVHTIHGFGHPAFQNPLARALAVALERRAARVTDRFIAVSQANIEEGRALGLFARAPVELIRSGFDLDRFRQPGVTRAEARARLGLPAVGPIVGSIACLKPQKAPLDLVRAAAQVRAAVPDCRFVVAGDGEQRPEVEREIARLRLGDAFALLGWRDDVPQILAALDAFLLTSRWEGLPRSLVQAMAAGVPVVATAADGTRDVVADGRTGFLVPVGDVAGAAARVTQLLRDPALRAELAAAAQAMVPEFDVADMVLRQERLYGQLAERGGGEP